MKKTKEKKILYFPVVYNFPAITQQNIVNAIKSISTLIAMNFDIYIERKISKGDIFKALVKTLNVGNNEIMFLGEESRDLEEVYLTAKFLIDYFIRPAGFRTSVDIWTSVFKNKEETYSFLQSLSEFILTRIFIDESENYGKLFTPFVQIKDVKFDINTIDGVNYVYVIE